MSGAVKPAKSRNRRDRQRAKRELARQRQTARNMQWVREAAQRMEATHEDMAPRQQRTPVWGWNIDPKTKELVMVELREPLAVFDGKTGSFRRNSSLWQMHNRDDKLVTKRHLSAAGRFQADQERSFGASRTCIQQSDRVDGGARTDISAIALDAIERYREACAALGPLSAPVRAVVCYGWSVGQLAEYARMEPHRASGYLIAGLDVLVAFYWPERAPRLDLPEPAEVLVDPRVTDIAQDRLGRFVREPAEEESS